MTRMKSLECCAVKRIVNGIMFWSGTKYLVDSRAGGYANYFLLKVVSK